MASTERARLAEPDPTVERAGDGFPTEPTSKPLYSVAQAVGAINRSRSAWETGATVAYSFRESLPPGESTSEFRPFTAVERELTRLAFDMISDVINLTFVELPDDGVSTGDADRIYLAADGALPDYEWGHAQRWTYGNAFTGREIASAEIWLSTDAVARRAWFAGGYNFQALMHEIGHAIGLSHPGDYNADGDEITYSLHAEYLQDSRQFSIMSYFAASHTGADHLVDSKAGLYSGATPLLHDIAALQALYGANTSTRAGDTVYGYNSTAGRAPYDFAQNTTPIFTIWDGGGTDWLDFSQTALQVHVDLRPGAFSDAFEMTNNISIAYGVTIENARGGMGHDILSGNDAANALYGGAGADRLDGLVGSDLLFGEVGDDVVGGQDGDDFIDGGLGRDILFGDAGNDHMVGGADADELRGQDGNDRIGGQDGDDFIDGALGRDTLFGDAGVDHIVGGAEADGLFGQDGDDLIGGQDGDDFIDGGAGRDRLFGDTGADHIIGGGESDELRGLDGDDRIGGQDGDDIIDGASGRDTLFGDAGADHIIGGADADGIFGQDGDDRIGGQDGDDFIDGGPGWDALFGDAGADHLVAGADGDALHGQDGDDLMGGQDGDDILLGGAGFDRLFGDAGNDMIDGGAGGDLLTGNGGADRFVFSGVTDSAPGARDRITDFRPGEGDVIDLSRIDANVGAAGDQAFVFVGGFTGQAGQAVLSASGADTLLSLDVNGDGLSDLQLEIAGGAGAGAGFLV